jgi:hypothetical protein
MAHDNIYDKELEDIMKSRYVPEMRSNLAERIIDASKYHEKQGHKGFKLWFYSFRDAFLIPQPILVMSLLFILGIFAGGYVNLDFLDSNDELSVQEYIYTAEDIGEGDWL